MLKIKHLVNSPDYRSPAGPVSCGSPIRFKVELEVNPVAVDSVRLFYLYGLEEFREGYCLMRREVDSGKNCLFSCDLVMDEEPGLFFYWFEVRLTDGRYRWGFPDPETRGMTAVTLECSPSFAVDGSEAIPGFQVTVHDRNLKTPDWMKGAVLYQIFPDRFSRGSRFDQARALELMNRPERIWHADWTEDVDYEGLPPGGYEACDFYGGTLQGIIEGLAYLASLGVTVLYLNPVFEARSNHRYDTGDYLSVDPLLGATGDLERLFEEAGKKGIRVILDGVFSHTGSDSLYFNRYDRYGTIGAWQEMRDGIPSDYTSWYRFMADEQEGQQSGEAACIRSPLDRQPLLYECWWDFHCLPNVNEDDLTYRSFICGPDGVLAHWIRKGCAGFRLDVSDEIPDSFLKLIRKRVKQEDPDALILGEIWEEPTARISYGRHRDFLFGHTHDAVMGYPFRQDLIAFLKDQIEGGTFASALEKMISITPKEALFVQMNLLGSHDTKRIMTELAGASSPGNRPEQASVRMTHDQRRRGGELLVLATLVQLAFPGAMSVYYGDELGMEGYDDPFNRRTFPEEALTGKEPDGLTRLVTGLTRLRQETPVLKTGLFEILHAGRDALVFRRYTRNSRDAFGHPIQGPEEALIAINRGGDRVEFPSSIKIPPLSERGGKVYLDGSEVFAFEPD